MSIKKNEVLQCIEMTHAIESIGAMLVDQLMRRLAVAEQRPLVIHNLSSGTVEHIGYD